MAAIENNVRGLVTAGKHPIGDDAMWKVSGELDAAVRHPEFASLPQELREQASQMRVDLFRGAAGSAVEVLKFPIGENGRKEAVGRLQEISADDRFDLLEPELRKSVSEALLANA